MSVDASGPGSRAVRSIAAVHEFRCIGEACRFSCCRDWKIEMSEADHARLVPLRLARDVGRPRVVATAARPCVYLDAASRCEIQRDHGAATMPDLCRTFPRQLRPRGDALEFCGDLACPEYTRLVLERPLDRTDLGREHVPEAFPESRPEHADDSSFARYAAILRPALQQVAAQDAVSAQLRCFALACLARESAQIIAESDDDERACRRLGSRARQFERHETWAEVNEVLLGQSVPREPILRALGYIALQALETDVHPEFRRLVTEGLRVESADAWLTQLEAREQVMERYARASPREPIWRHSMALVRERLHSDGLMIDGTVFDDVQRRLVELALIRLLTLVHPRFADEKRQSPAPQIFIDVASLCYRTLAHHVGFRSSLRGLLDTNGLTGLAASVCLIRF